MIVKAGDTWVNFDRVSMIRERRDADHQLTGDLAIYFHANRQVRALVKGYDAEALRRYLAQHAVGSEGGSTAVGIDSGGFDGPTGVVG